jgi:hypothetical protein
VLAKVEEAKSSAAPRGKGPAKVSTAAYRESWDRIFGEAGQDREKTLN